MANSNNPSIDPNMIPEHVIDKIMFTQNGSKKMNIKVPFVRTEDIKIGKKFWYIDNVTMKPFLMTITYIRSGIVFYSRSDKQGEDYFPLKCVMAQRLEPEVYQTEYDSRYYNFTSFSDKVIIEYINQNRE